MSHSIPSTEIAAGNDLMKRTYSKYIITRKENKCKQACIQHIYAIFFVELNKIVTIVVSRGSSVSIVSDYGLDNWAIEVRSPTETKGFFL
jgi:hypothetical protein